MAGTVFSDGKARIIQIKGIDMEAEFGPHMLYVTNEDKPGFIGALGMLLGNAGVNIATFNLGRKAQGGEAICLVSDRRAAARHGAGGAVKAAAGEAGQAAGVLSERARAGYCPAHHLRDVGAVDGDAARGRALDLPGRDSRPASCLPRPLTSRRSGAICCMPISGGAAWRAAIVSSRPLSFTQRLALRHGHGARRHAAFGREVIERWRGSRSDPVRW